MLTGTAAVDTLAAALPAPVLPAWGTEPLVLTEVTVVQVIAELRRRDRETFLPPSLHPTDPPALSIQAWRVGGGDLGPFAFVHTRLSCRSGVRARGLTTAAYVDGDQAESRLREQFGYPCRSGRVRVDAHYDGVDVRVTVDGDDVLVISALDPDPLGADDVQYTATLNLADTPNGLRLVQVESHHEPTSVDRVAARITRFVAGAWGDERLDPYHVVTTTIARDRRLELPPVRFVCRPDVNAFEGTEAIGR